MTRAASVPSYPSAAPLAAVLSWSAVFPNVGAANRSPWIGPGGQLADLAAVLTNLPVGAPGSTYLLPNACVLGALGWIAELLVANQVATFQILVNGVAVQTVAITSGAANVQHDAQSITPIVLNRGDTIGFKWINALGDTPPGNTVLYLM